MTSTAGPPHRRTRPDPSAGTAPTRGRRAFLAIISWVPRLAWLNLIWIVQTLAGGILLGVAPATRVLYQLTRESLESGTSTSFAAWQRWRTQFWSSQALLLLPLATTLPLAGYIWMLRGTPFAITITLVAAAYVCWLLHVPAVAAISPAPRVPRLWMDTLRLFAHAVPLYLATLAATVGTLLGLLWFTPAALVVAVPSIPALVGTLVVRAAAARTPGSPRKR